MHHHAVLWGVRILTYGWAVDCPVLRSGSQQELSTISSTIRWLYCSLGVILFVSPHSSLALGQLPKASHKANFHDHPRCWHNASQIKSPCGLHLLPACIAPSASQTVFFFFPQIYSLPILRSRYKDGQRDQVVIKGCPACMCQGIQHHPDGAEYEPSASVHFSPNSQRGTL